MLMPDGIEKSDSDAPDSQRRRLCKLRATLRAAGSGNADECLTAADLEDELGWDREIIEATIAKLRRESKLMLENPDVGWRLDES
jgi:hypothetical protein